MSLFRLLARRWRERIQNYAPRRFPTAEACGAFYDARGRLFGGNDAAVLEYSSLDVQHRLFRRAAQALPPHGRVLDVGCGLAHLADFLRDEESPVESYYGIDVSASMLKRASERLRDRPDVALERLDLTTEPLPRRAFDTGYLISVLGYPIGKDPMATMMTILCRTLDACTDGLVFTHILNGRTERSFPFAMDPERLALRCERAAGARATIHDDGTDFTYLIALRWPDSAGA